MSIAYKHLSGGCRCPARPSTRSRPSSTGSWRAPPTATERCARSALAMHHDLDAIAPSLPAGTRGRSSTTRPRSRRFDDGTTTDVVVLGDAAATRELETTTATIARVERVPAVGGVGSWASSPRVRARRLGLGVDVSDPHRADVPALAGVSVDEARDRLSGLGFAVVIADGQYSFASRGGSRDPCAAGARNLAGAGRDGHDRALARPGAGEGPEHRGHDPRTGDHGSKAGLDVSIVKRRYDDEIPEGSVIEQRQTGMVPSGSTVEVVVSKDTHRSRFRRSPA